MGRGFSRAVTRLFTFGFSRGGDLVIARTAIFAGG